MYQIGLVGKPSRLRFRLRKVLEEHPDFHVIIFSTADQLVMGMKHFDLSCIVLVLDGLVPSQLRNLNLIDGHFQRIPVLFVAPEIPPGLRLDLNKRSYRNLSVIDARTELKDITPIIMKISGGESVFQRAHVRYQTNQYGEIKNSDGKVYRARIVNLSTGGAQLEFNGPMDITDSEVTLNVRSLRKTSYGIRARIKWRNQKSGQVGIEFCLPNRPRTSLSLVQTNDI